MLVGLVLNPRLIAKGEEHCWDHRAAWGTWGNNYEYPDVNLFSHLLAKTTK